MHQASRALPQVTVNMLVVIDRTVVLPNTGKAVDLMVGKKKAFTANKCSGPSLKKLIQMCEQTVQWFIVACLTPRLKCDNEIFVSSLGQMECLANQYRFQCKRNEFSLKTSMAKKLGERHDESNKD